MTCLMLASAVTGKDVLGEMCRVGGKGGGGQTEWTGGGLGGKEEVPDFRLQLGRKVLKTTSTELVLDEDGDGNEDEGAKGGQEAQLTAISLWTSGAKDVVPLL